jgi:hypothetical protein
MLQTMLWVSFSLNMATPWRIIVRHYQMLSVSTLLMTKKCTPLCKPAASGDITFWGRRQSSTLITSHYSSCRPKENCRMTAIRSGPHTYNSSTSTSSIKIGSTNRVVDCLSRPPVATLTTVLDSCGHETSGWPHLYETDPDFSTTYQMLGENSVVTNFHLQDGLLCRLGHLCVPSSEHAKLIWEAHYSRVAGHFGVEKTVAVLQKHFYWPKLRQDVSKYIRSCTACAIAKPTTKKQGLYTPLPTPNKPWESISMDYMSGLPSTKRGNDCVFVVVDRFSKMAIMAACKKNITTEATAKIFFECVWVHFGIPQTIVSDRDSRFLNTFWSSLWSLLDTKLTKSTAFHPQTDGQTEVINQMIVHILCMYNSKHPHTWDESLPYVQHSYNRALHSSTGHNPFQVGLGFQPLGPMDVALPLVNTCRKTT